MENYQFENQAIVLILFILVFLSWVFLFWVLRARFKFKDKLNGQLGQLLQTSSVDCNFLTGQSLVSGVYEGHNAKIQWNTPLGRGGPVCRLIITFTSVAIEPLKVSSQTIWELRRDLPLKLPLKSRWRQLCLHKGIEMIETKDHDLRIYMKYYAGSGFLADPTKLSLAAADDIKDVLSLASRAIEDT